MKAPVVTLRRACQIEVPCLERGRPSYRWVQGWTYTTPRGGECAPDTLKNIQHLAAQDYPGARIVRAA